MICASKGKHHGHCMVCFTMGCECYPLDLWACVEDSIGNENWARGVRP